MDHSYSTERDRLHKTDHCYFTVARKTPAVVLRKAQQLKADQSGQRVDGTTRPSVDQDHSYTRPDQLDPTLSALWPVGKQESCNSDEDAGAERPLQLGSLSLPQPLLRPSLPRSPWSERLDAGSQQRHWVAALGGTTGQRHTQQDKQQDRAEDKEQDKEVDSKEDIAVECGHVSYCPGMDCGGGGVLPSPLPSDLQPSSELRGRMEEIDPLSHPPLALTSGAEMGGGVEDIDALISDISLDHTYEVRLTAARPRRRLRAACCMAGTETNRGADTSIMMQPVKEEMREEEDLMHGELREKQDEPCGEGSSDTGVLAVHADCIHAESQPENNAMSIGAGSQTRIDNVAVAAGCQTMNDGVPEGAGCQTMNDSFAVCAGCQTMNDSVEVGAGCQTMNDSVAVGAGCSNINEGLPLDHLYCCVEDFPSLPSPHSPRGDQRFWLMSGNAVMDWQGSGGRGLRSGGARRGAQGRLTDHTYLRGSRPGLTGRRGPDTWPSSLALSQSDHTYLRGGGRGRGSDESREDGWGAELDTFVSPPPGETTGSKGGLNWGAGDKAICDRAVNQTGVMEVGVAEGRREGPDTSALLDDHCYYASMQHTAAVCQTMCR